MFRSNWSAICRSDVIPTLFIQAVDIVICMLEDAIFSKASVTTTLSYWQTKHAFTPPLVDKRLLLRAALIFILAPTNIAAFPLNRSSFVTVLSALSA